MRFGQHRSALLWQQEGERGALLLDNRGSPERSKSVGMEGPNMSASRIPDRRPSRANANDKFAIERQKLDLGNRKGSEEYDHAPATVLLPTPPLADETAMTLSTPAIFRL